MSRRSIAPRLCNNEGLALCHETQGSPTLKLLSVDGDRAREGAMRRAAGITPHRCRPLRMVARGADLMLDITAEHYDVTGYARRRHAWGALISSETQHLILALLAFLAEPPDLAAGA